MAFYCDTFCKVTTFMVDGNMVVKVSCKGCPTQDTDVCPFRGWFKGDTSSNMEYKLEVNEKASLKQHLENVKRLKGTRVHSLRKFSPEVTNRLRVFSDLEDCITIAFRARFIEGNSELELSALNNALFLIKELCPEDFESSPVYNFKDSLLGSFKCYDVITLRIQEAKFRSVFENTSRVAVYLSEAWGLIRSRISYLLFKPEKDRQKKYRVVIADGGAVNSSNIIQRLEDALSLFRDTLVQEFNKDARILYSYKTGDWSWLGDVRRVVCKGREVSLVEFE